jgi:polyketide biosynthesis enoyl-CoA hydratase PksH
MGFLGGEDRYQTVRVQLAADVCTVQIHRPQANNTICARLVEELADVLDRCEQDIKVLVLEGSPEVFCTGADFSEIEQSQRRAPVQDPGPLYDLWLRLASGPYVSIAHVRGKANAGGVGFVAACDVALADERATFSLSELLFGLMPACVLPFLIRRTGTSKAHYMTLMTQPVSARQACEWGLLDACEDRSDQLLRRHLLRLQRLSKPAIARYKRYIGELDDSLAAHRAKALRANLEVFTDERNLRNITNYVRTGRFPWEACG